MEFSVIIIGAAILLLIFIPIALVHKKRDKEEKATLHRLNSAAAAGQSIIKHDLWNNSAIGLDSAGTLYFIENNSADVKKINLKGIKECRIINSGRAVINHLEDPYSIRRLELALTGSHYEYEQRLLFFDAAVDLQINDELQLIKKWEAIINNHIKAN
ncbi:hypothetical protein [Flavobacterium coralii]|uniref:hypothetical protein n=1 Tax=Flavobacterium coralii TaxID=2838017 RepID=UPI000C547103|nr:hypothetical protein [Flavobacterium sp.]|tara:strand:+ start:83450 stop:83923 length:474 start_codon:yes stop_codon:yes gene_type:complete